MQATVLATMLFRVQGKPDASALLLSRNLSGERYPAPRAAQDIRDVGTLDSLSISDVPRDRLRRSGNSGTFQQQQQQQQ